MRNPTWSRAAAVAAISAAVFFGLQARGGSAGVPAPAPPAVALVDVSKITSGLTETKDLIASQKLRFDAYDKQIEQAVADAKGAEADLKEAETKNLPDLNAKRTRYLEARMLTEARRRALNDCKVLDMGATLGGVYKKATAAIQKVAEEQGLDLVLLDDSSIEPQSDMSPEDLSNKVIARRKVLYMRPRLDITQDVITRMNNDYAAQKKN